MAVIAKCPVCGGRISVDAELTDEPRVLHCDKCDTRFTIHRKEKHSARGSSGGPKTDSEPLSAHVLERAEPAADSDAAAGVEHRPAESAGADDVKKAVAPPTIPPVPIPAVPPKMPKPEPVAEGAAAAAPLIAPEAKPAPDGVRPMPAGPASKPSGLQAARDVPEPVALKPSGALMAIIIGIVFLIALSLVIIYWMKNA